MLVSGVRVASGNATPLTKIVVGSMSVTGMKFGVEFVEPKTKICKLAGLVALMLKGRVRLADADRGLDPGGNRNRDQPALHDLGTAGTGSSTLREVIPRRTDNEVALIVEIRGIGRGLQSAGNGRPEEVGGR